VIFLFFFFLLLVRLLFSLAYFLCTWVRLTHLMIFQLLIKKKRFQNIGSCMSHLTPFSMFLRKFKIYSWAYPCHTQVLFELFPTISGIFLPYASYIIPVCLYWILITSGYNGSCPACFLVGNWYLYLWHKEIQKQRKRIVGCGPITEIKE
jgi:hypothetical protein